MQNLAELYISSKEKNLFLRDRALEIIREFKSQNVDFLVLKGLYFAFDVYPDAGLRPMVDIDFLIHRNDLNKINKIFRESGYEEVSPEAQRSYGCDSTFCSKGGTYLDIHWDLCQYERFKRIIDMTADFWKRAGEFSLDGLGVKTLSLEDHILYIALHYCLVHFFEDIKGAYDLFYLIDKNPVKWDEIIRRACGYGVKIPLYYSLLKTSDVTHLKLPDFALERLKPSYAKRILLDYLLRRHKKTILRYLCQSLMMDSFSDTLRVLWRMVKSAPRVLRMALSFL